LAWIGTVLVGFCDGRARAVGQVIFDSVGESGGHYWHTPRVVLNVTWSRGHSVHLHDGRTKAVGPKYIVRDAQFDPVHEKIDYATGLLQFRKP